LSRAPQLQYMVRLSSLDSSTTARAGSLAIVRPVYGLLELSRLAANYFCDSKASGITIAINLSNGNISGHGLKARMFVRGRPVVECGCSVRYWLLWPDLVWVYLVS